MRYGVWAPIPQYASGVRKWTSGRNGRRITAVVIHRMDGTLDGSDSWLRSPYSGSASTHFGVGAMGWLNRSLRRWQIRQWVDTTNTAYGWAARPTDDPTELARRVLPPDLYDWRADLNWQVIAVEVEGFYYNQWAPGLANKVKELLYAIARAHGPLIVMAHTDCSTKPCPGMTTFKAAMPGWYGSRILLPDTAAPSELPLRFKPIRRVYELGPGVNVRTAPKLNAPIRYTTQTTQRHFVYGEVPGEMYNGTTLWYMWWSPTVSTADGYDGKWVYVNRSLAKRV